MSRGLTDEPVQPEQPNDPELNNIINEIIKGQNRLHDRIIDLERQADHAKPCKNCKCKNGNTNNTEAESEAADRKFWKKGL